MPMALNGTRAAGDLAVGQHSAIQAGRCAPLAGPGGMSVKKLPSGRWFAELKSGRSYVTGKAFDSRREAQAWYGRERAVLAGGVDPRAGRATVRTLLPTWLEVRRHSVAAKTYVADAA